jgi:hypothetical protein
MSKIIVELARSAAQEKSSKEKPANEPNEQLGMSAFVANRRREASTPIHERNVIM